MQDLYFGGYVTFQFAEVAVPRKLFQNILELIDDLRRKIQALGIWFSLGSVAPTVALGGRVALPNELVIVSTGAIGAGHLCT